tara:strand:+ start:374 stop:589 length:216 start_codon:yes stop_codon:yes gene_type:complete
MEKDYDYKIEKGIPINYWDSVAKKMEVGDSILFPKRDNTRSLRYSLKSQGFKSIGRTVPNGYRIWKGEKEK